MGLNNPTLGSGGGAPATQPYVKTASPTTGQTVGFDNVSADHTFYLTPAGALATLTVSLPSNATSTLGQTVTLATSQTLTALTINGAASIINNVTTLLGSATVSFRKVANDTWIQV